MVCVCVCVGCFVFCFVLLFGLFVCLFGFWGVGRGRGVWVFWVSESGSWGQCAIMVFTQAISWRGTRKAFQCYQKTESIEVSKEGTEKQQRQTYSTFTHLCWNVVVLQILFPMKCDLPCLHHSIKAWIIRTVGYFWDASFLIPSKKQAL